MNPWLTHHRKTFLWLNGILLLAALILNQWHPVSNSLLLLASISGIIPIGFQAISGLRYGILSIELLVTLAVVGAFILRRFDESAVVTFLFLMGSYLETYTLKKTHRAIEAMLELAPDQAYRKTSTGQFEWVDVNRVNRGDCIAVHIGEKIPVDGIVIAEHALVDESMITGEPTAKYKSEGMPVYAGTFVEQGSLEVRTLFKGENTTVGKIIARIEHAHDSKTKTERFIARFARYYTPFVLILAIMVGILTKNLEKAITLLVLGCPGALVIGIPVATVAGIGHHARKGILIKDSATIEALAQKDAVFFDKTGTITKGKPQVQTFECFKQCDSRLRIKIASLEAKARHSLSQVITEYMNVDERVAVTQMKTVHGKGVEGFIEDEWIRVGNRALMDMSGIVIEQDEEAVIQMLEVRGETAVLIANETELVAVIGIDDPLRKDVPQMIKDLEAQGIRDFRILSGDHQQAVNKVIRPLKSVTGFGDLLPEDKVHVIQEAQDDNRRVMFVGDGINDSPAFTEASVSVAVGSGADLALETADVVILKDNLLLIPEARTTSQKTVKIMKQNVIIAIGVVLILLVALMTQSWLSMGVGMLIHEGSILVVILNALRILREKEKEGMSNERSNLES